MLQLLLHPNIYCHLPLFKESSSIRRVCYNSLVHSMRVAIQYEKCYWGKLKVLPNPESSLVNQTLNIEREKFLAEYKRIKCFIFETTPRVPCLHKQLIWHMDHAAKGSQILANQWIPKIIVNWKRKTLHLNHCTSTTILYMSISTEKNNSVRVEWVGHGFHSCYAKLISVNLHFWSICKI